MIANTIDERKEGRQYSVNNSLQRIWKPFRNALCNGLYFDIDQINSHPCIILALCKIKHGKQKKLFLGNLYAKRDWGHAKDYCYAMWKILQQKKADDFVIATGKQYSVKEFANLTMKELGIKYSWKGSGINEKCLDQFGKVIIQCDPAYYRPLEVDTLLGDSSKARKILKWKPKINIKMLVKEMVNSEISNLGND